ncbi:MAG: hypothetical protein AAF745_01305 [Planctomycetota bacterium]
MLISAALRLLSHRRSLVCGCLSLLLSLNSGCLGLLSNFMHTIGADRVPAEFDGLNDCKVAIVTRTDSSEFSDDVVARLLTRKVGDRLRTELDDAEFVRDDDVQTHLDRHGYDASDLQSIGIAVGADKVLGIDVTELSLREGATLFRGRANARITIVDVATGSELFGKDIDEYTYPRTAGQYTTETTEPRFRKLYLEMLADQIARTFHPYDFHETVALDGAIASQ